MDREDSSGNYVRVYSGAPRGIEATVVEVEIDFLNKLPSIQTVGLPEAAVREAKDRIRSAIQNSGFEVPRKRIMVNLAPARIRKQGTAFDLPIAVGVLAADDEIRSTDRLERYALLGELGLEGRVRPVPGVLPVVLAAREAGLKGILVPRECAAEGSCVEGIDVIGIENLATAVAFLRGAIELEPEPATRDAVAEPDVQWDFSEVVGLESARRAAEIAAAGGHNLLMIGPPGAGKTLLARRLPGILPPLEIEEAFEVTRVYSVAGLLRPGEGLRRTRPFRAPHHTTSTAGLIGGGTPPRPGEVTLAHRGVLFLDELPEFSRASLEGLRQPLEDRDVVIARARERIRYPASFMLVAAMNPCPCGQALSGLGCDCAANQIARYRSRISGPLLDRIDLQVEVHSVAWEKLQKGVNGESSAQIRERVLAARARQVKRLEGRCWKSNAELPGRDLEEFCPMDPPARRLLLSLERPGRSARMYHRLLKVARTCADLEGADRICERHVLEAVSFRLCDNEARDWVDASPGAA